MSKVRQLHLRSSNMTSSIIKSSSNQISLNKRIYRGVLWGPGDVSKVSNIFGIFLCILFQLPLQQNILNWQLELLLERPFSSFYPVGNYQFQIDGHLTKLLRIIKNLGWNSVEYIYIYFLGYLLLINSLFWSQVWIWVKISLRWK